MDNLEYKTFTARVKDLNESEGRVQFVASVFGNKDLGNEVVLPGAFTKTLSDRTPKFMLDHMLSAQYKLGKVNSAVEGPEGLVVDASFNMDKTIARETFSDFQFDPQGVEFSIGYKIPTGGSETKDGVKFLKQLDLYEVSVVGVGMNPETRLLAAKSLIESVKELEDEMTEISPIENKAVDNSAWDGPHATSEALAADDPAAAFRSIAFEASDGAPDEAQHWKLPHHYVGKGPNADGVHSALSYLPRTDGLKDPAAAKSHLEAHAKEINPDYEAPKEIEEVETKVATELDALRIKLAAKAMDLVLKHANAPYSVQTAHDSLMKAGAVCDPANCPDMGDGGMDPAPDASQL